MTDISYRDTYSVLGVNIYASFLKKKSLDRYGHNVVKYYHLDGAGLRDMAGDWQQVPA
jgi:hypothetical protein